MELKTAIRKTKRCPITKFFAFLVVVGAFLLYLFPESANTKGFFISVAVITVASALCDHLRDSFEELLQSYHKEISLKMDELGAQIKELGVDFRDLSTEVTGFNEIGTIGLKEEISRIGAKTEDLGEEIRLLREQVEALVDDMDTQKGGEGYGS